MKSISVRVKARMAARATPSNVKGRSQPAQEQQRHVAKFLVLPIRHPVCDPAQPARLTIRDTVPNDLRRLAFILGMFTPHILALFLALSFLIFPPVADVDTLKLQMACFPLKMNMTEIEGATMPDFNGKLPPVVYGEPEVQTCLNQSHHPGDICYVQKVTFQVQKEVMNSVSTNKTNDFNKIWYRNEMTRYYNYHCAPGINVSQKFFYSVVLLRSRISTNIYSDFDIDNDSFLMRLRVTFKELYLPDQISF
ncbi:hypothetical protein J6590_000773 [Homalodisca vitripennis]|nr:hypothetical protein J6590_000773 [Homalodisca vitripennis]